MVKTRLPEIKVFDSENMQEIALIGPYRRSGLESTFERGALAFGAPLGDAFYNNGVSIERLGGNQDFRLSYHRLLAVPPPQIQQQDFSDFIKATFRIKDREEGFWLFSEAKEKEDPSYGCNFTLLYRDGKIQTLNFLKLLTEEHFTRFLEYAYGVGPEDIKEGYKLREFIRDFMKKRDLPFWGFENYPLGVIERHNPKRIISKVVDYAFLLKGIKA